MNYSDIPHVIWKNEIFPRLTIQELFKLEIASKYFQQIIDEIKERRNSEYLLIDVFGHSKEDADSILKDLDEDYELMLLNFFPDGEYEIVSDIFDVISAVAYETTATAEHSAFQCDDDDIDDEEEDNTKCEVCDDKPYLKEQKYLLCQKHLADVLHAHPMDAFRVHQLFMGERYHFDWDYCELDEEDWKLIFKKRILNFVPKLMIFGYQTNGMAGTLTTGLFLGKSIDEENNEEDEEESSEDNPDNSPTRKKQKT